MASSVGVFASVVHDLRDLLRLAEGRNRQPTAAIFDSRTLRSSVEGGERAGYDGAKRERGPKVRLAADTPGGCPPGGMQDRAAADALAAQVQGATGDHVSLAYVDQGHTGEAAQAAGAHGIALAVVGLPGAERGFVLLPRRRAVETGCPLGRPARATRSRRPVRDYERLPETPAGLHLVAFVFLMPHRAFAAATGS